MEDSVNEPLTGPGGFLEPARPASEVSTTGADDTGSGRQPVLRNRVPSSGGEPTTPPLASSSENSMDLQSEGLKSDSKKDFPHTQGIEIGGLACPPLGDLKSRMEAVNVIENCALASRDLTVHRGSQLSRPPPAAWISSTGAAPSWKRSAQDTRPRTSGVSRMTSPGMEPSGHRAELHYDPTDNTCVRPGPHLSFLCNPPSGVRSPCLSPGAPAHLPTGFVPKGSRNAFVLTQNKNKGLRMLVPNRQEAGTVGEGAHPPQGPRTAQRQPIQEGLRQHAASQGWGGERKSGQVRHF